MHGIFSLLGLCILIVGVCTGNWSGYMYKTIVSALLVIVMLLGGFAYFFSRAQKVLYKIIMRVVYIRSF